MDRIGEEAVKIASEVGKVVGPVSVLIVTLYAISVFGPKTDVSVSKADKVDVAQISTMLLSRIEHLESRVQAAQSQSQECLLNSVATQRQLNDAHLKFAILKSTHEQWPFPVWTKNKFGVIKFANAAYEEIFLTPRGYDLSDYIGHDDYSVWPKEIADEFRAADEYVMRTGQTIIKTESVPQGDGSVIEMTFFKFPAMYNNEIVGTSGAYIPAVKVK